MAEEKTSFLTQVVEGLAGELDTRRRTAKDGIPLGKKSVTRQKAKNDLQAMSPEQRKRFVDDNGMDEVMRETSICGLGQVALTPVLSILERFPNRGGGS